MHILALKDKNGRMCSTSCRCQTQRKVQPTNLLWLIFWTQPCQPVLQDVLRKVLHNSKEKLASIERSGEI